MNDHPNQERRAADAAGGVGQAAKLSLRAALTELRYVRDEAEKRRVQNTGTEELTALAWQLQREHTDNAIRLIGKALGTPPAREAAPAVPPKATDAEAAVNAKWNRWCDGVDARAAVPPEVLREVREALRECAEWLETRPDHTEGDAATAGRARKALVALEERQ